jgi:type II secretory pathway component PulC
VDFRQRRRLPLTAAVAVVLLASTGSGQTASAPLSPSTLPLRLVGVLRDQSTPANSRVLIQCGDPREERTPWLFAVGEPACDSAEIKEVMEEAVVIRNLLTNRLERLTLPKAARPAAPQASSSQEPISPADIESSAGPRVLPVSADVVTVELRQELVDHYTANLPEVLSSAMATPHYATSESGASAMDGYEVNQIKSGGIVEQLGLQNGDVILDFNGQKLDSLAAVTALLAQPQALSGSTMTVLRSGSRKTFVFVVR